MDDQNYSQWYDRAAQQLVSYEALVKLLDEIQPLEDIGEISSRVAKQWKYFANVACWRLVVVKENRFLVIDAFRGEAHLQEVENLSPWDDHHFKQRLPRLIKVENLKDEPAPPEQFRNKAVMEVGVIPFMRVDRCIGVLSVAARHVPFTDLDNKFIRIFGSHFTDRIYSTLLRQLSLESLVRKATHDALTGILNRGSILERLDMLFQVSRRSIEPLSVILVDIDHFKKINDEYGHLIGDAALREVSRRLQFQTREADHLGRYGGEEFLLVLYPCNADKVIVAAERFRQAVANSPIPIETDPFYRIDLTISLGTSTLVKGDRKIETLLKRADEALYVSKSKGRNRVTSG